MNKGRVNAGALPEPSAVHESPAPTAPLSPGPHLSAELCILLHLHWAPAHPSPALLMPYTPKPPPHYLAAHPVQDITHTSGCWRFTGLMHRSLIKDRRKVKVHSHLVLVEAELMESFDH